MAFSNYLPPHYIARPTTKRHLAGDCLQLRFPPNWGGVIIFRVFIDICYRSILPNRRSIQQSIVRFGVSTIDAHFLLAIEIGERGIRKWKARRRSLFRPKGRNLFDLETDFKTGTWPTSERGGMAPTLISG